jgi:hypothetical membrane protein
VTTERGHWRAVVADADTERVAVACGAASAVGTPALIVLATLVAPWFSWPDNALSDLGVAPETALLFNGALIGGGLLALPFAWLLWAELADASGRLRRAVVGLRAVVFTLTSVTLAGIGAFPSDTALHFPVAVGFFLLLTALLVLDGLDRWRARTGRLALAGAAVHVLGWIVWGQEIRPGPGLALPEFVGALALSGWIVFLAPVAPLPVGDE